MKWQDIIRIKTQNYDCQQHEKRSHLLDGLKLRSKVDDLQWDKKSQHHDSQHYEMLSHNYEIKGKIMKKVETS